MTRVDERDTGQEQNVHSLVAEKEAVFSRSCNRAKELPKNKSSSRKKAAARKSRSPVDISAQAGEVASSSSSSAVQLAPQALHVGAIVGTFRSKHRSRILRADCNNEEFSAFYTSALKGYPANPSVLNASSRRVRVPARINTTPVDHITIDTACDIPCISHAFIRRHNTLKDAEISPVPPGAINLRSADGSALKIKGYIRFELTLGELTLPVEALVLPTLGPDNMLLDNSIMGAFGGVLDWQAEELSFKTSSLKIKATHRRTRSPSHTGAEEHNCSIVALDTDTQPVPVYLRKKCSLPARHEIALEAYTLVEPPAGQGTTALVEPRIVSAMDLDSPDTPQAFRRIVVARTVCHWSPFKGAVVQIANPSNRVVRLNKDTLVGYISPVKTVEPQTISSVQSDLEETAKHRTELQKALTKAFENTTFSSQQCEELLQLCTRYRSVFSLKPDELGTCTLTDADFPLQPGTQPVNRAPYRTNPRAQEVIDKCVEEMEQAGIVEQRASPWGSAVTLVAKADGTPRFCVDYRPTINKNLIRKSWPMPEMASHIDTVAGAKFITVCDVQSAYHQIPVTDPNEQDKTAFVTSKGKWVFKRLPFGIANAPFLFQRTMALAFAHFGPKSGLLVYMDDLICCSSTWEGHMTLLEKTFQSLQAAGLTLKPSKVQFGPKEVKYLGHILSSEGIRLGEDRIKSIIDLPTPTNIKELRSVLGMVNYVRKFIPDLATITAPLVDLTKKEAVKSVAKRWGPEHDDAFAEIKQRLTKAPVLHFPDFSKEFVIHVDASEVGAGAFLAQTNGNDLNIIAYFSQRFNKSQQHYSATMKECYAVVLAIQHWRPYLWGRHFTCVTDHAALRYLYTMQDTSNMLTRWAIAMQSFDFTVQHKPGKLHVVPDTLSRLFAFANEQERLVPSLAPICRNVPDDPNLQTAIPQRPYQVSADKLNEVQPVTSDRELFSVSATSVFESIDEQQLRNKQQAEYGEYIRYIENEDAPLPEQETTTTMSYYSVQDGILFKSYLPGHLRKRSTFKDQLVLPANLTGLVMHAYHDHALSGGHFAYKPTYEKIRQKYWWPSMTRDIRTWCLECQACQRRKTAHRRSKLPIGHAPVERPFQRISVDLVEYKSMSRSSTGVPCKYVLSMMDHLTRFAILTPVPNKTAETIARVIIDRLISIFGPPETLHSDQGTEFENKIIHQLQTILGYQKTRTTPYRPQGNSVSERVHATMHTMLAMHSSLDCDNWADLLPMVQMAYNTSFNTTMHETPYFLMFGRQARLPVDVILGLPHVGTTTDTERFSQKTRDNLQIAFELARQNLKERADKQSAQNKKLPQIPVFEVGQKVLVYKPYQEADGPNPKLILPWRGPYIICSQLSPVVYRVRRANESREVSVHLAHLKQYYARQKPPAPQFNKLAEYFLGKRIPLPAVENDENQPRIERYIVDKVVDHKTGRGRKSLHNYKYRLRLKGYGPESDLIYRADEVPQCHEMISAYRAKHGLDIAPADQQSPRSQPIEQLKRKRDDSTEQGTSKRARHRKGHKKSQRSRPKEQQSKHTHGSGEHSKKDLSERAKNANTQRKSKRSKKANPKYISHVNKR